MKNLVLLLVSGGVLFAVFGMKGGNFSKHFKIPGQPASDERRSNLVGRWDEIGGFGYFRFAEDGYFRCELGTRLCEGEYQVLEGGGLELATSASVVDPRTQKTKVVKDVQEYKYTLDKGIFRIRIGALWTSFNRGSESVPEPRAPALIAPSPAVPSVPAAPVKDGERWRKA